MPQSPDPIQWWPLSLAATGWSPRPDLFFGHDRPDASVADLTGQLTAALGATYRIEQELGGGGMSRVFLAVETELGRQVVIKVLPPEMAAGVNQERFRREVQLAARLQHPHIVPLLTAGAQGDLLYYVMPFIKGESLRAKLAREGELPVNEAVRILREVTDALAYAHGEGVVHRDIKPDNVMISGGHALVTDFGVAKAVSASAGDHSLTSLGLAIGTPAYMAPEQAAGDPHVDHRADLYALGAMAFEMLIGRPPFQGANPQALLAAHISQAPEQVTALRPAVPPALNAVVMRCLEKRAADRWQSASELLPQLDMLLTPATGGTAPYMISSGTQAALARSHPVRAFTTYALASVGVLGVVWALVHFIGLPTWVFYGAIVLLVIGVPIIILTARHEHQRAIARTTSTYLAAPTGIKRFLTWERALGGGALAFAGLGVLTIAYMAMRLLGIGAVGTLLAKGTLNERDRIVLAEFENRTPDTTLGATITELLRTDLSQSRSVSVYDVGQLSEAVARMQLPRNTKVTFDVAKDVATRQGLKAILAGDITALGGAYIISARLVATGSGDVLWARRENVENASKISGAVDKLSGALREKVGESLRSIRADPALEDMTTASTEALRLYAQADRASNINDRDGAITLLERAVALDSNFASAHRRLGIQLRNRSVSDSARYNPEFRKAYELRDRLTTRERYQAEATYFSSIPHDTAKAVAAYKALLDQYPDDRVALNNLALIYQAQRRSAEALGLYKSAIRLKVAPSNIYTNALSIVTDVEGVDSAGAVIDEFIAAYPENPLGMQAKVNYLLSKERYDSAQTLAEKQLAATRGNAPAQIGALNQLISLAVLHGRLNDAASLVTQLTQVQLQLSPVKPGSPVTTQEVQTIGPLDFRARMLLGVADDTASALKLMEQSLAGVPAERRAQGDPYVFLQFVRFYAAANRPAIAESYWKKWEAAVPPAQRADPGPNPVSARADLAAAEHHFDDALRDYRRLKDKNPNCNLCYVGNIAAIFAQAGTVDSAIVYAERAVSAPQLGLRGTAEVYEHIAQLYEKRGDKQNAVKNYRRVAEFWKNADPVLQPRVKAAEAKIAELTK
ncbi:MAG TPA: protein kinase [Gemmatimonadaceae bacterium]|nr:protein kinase [Gemmatimonadaceae bacterium]